MQEAPPQRSVRGFFIGAPPREIELVVLRDFGHVNADAELVTALNYRVSRHLGASRRALFDDLEQSAHSPADPIFPWSQIASAGFFDGARRS